MSALGAAKSNTMSNGLRWRRILRRKPEAECRTASALNAPRRNLVGSEKAQPRLVVRTSRGVGGSPGIARTMRAGRWGIEEPVLTSFLAAIQASNIQDLHAPVAA